MQRHEIINEPDIFSDIEESISTRLYIGTIRVETERAQCFVFNIVSDTTGW